MTFIQVRDIALSFPETTEEPHFEKTSFRVKGKIFATWDNTQKQLCLKLSQKDQDLFALRDRSAVFPVPNKWGKQGWTIVKPEIIPEEMLKDALINAYCEVAPRKLASIVQNHN